MNIEAYKHTHTGSHTGTHTNTQGRKALRVRCRVPTFDMIEEAPAFLDRFLQFFVQPLFLLL